MNRKWLIGAALVFSLGYPLAVRAHEGHSHRVMGTVVTRHENHLQVKTREGKTITVTLTDKTSVVRGKEKADVDDLKAGERVVVDIGNGKEPITAREIKLGPAKS